MAVVVVVVVVVVPQLVTGRAVIGVLGSSMGAVAELSAHVPPQPPPPPPSPPPWS